MDTARINQLGSAPLQPYIHAIEGIESHDDVIHVAAKLHTVNIPVFFDWEVRAMSRGVVWCDVSCCVLCDM